VSLSVGLMLVGIGPANASAAPAASPAPPAAQPAGGSVHSISGHITGASGPDLQNVFVEVYSPAGPTVWTDASGNYTITGLADGSYTLWLFHHIDGFINAYYSATATGHAALLLADATPVVVSGADVTGIDVQLPVGHDIIGSIRDKDGNPFANVEVIANTVPPGSYWAGVTTDGGGYFSITVADSYTYTLRLDPPVASLYPYAYYKDSGIHSTLRPELATGITVGHANVVGVDIQLMPGLQIRGTVTGVGGAPLQNLTVQADSETTSTQASALSKADGTYTLIVPDSEAFRVRVADYNDVYFAGYYHIGSPGQFSLDWTTYSPITMSGSDRTAIDMQLPLQGPWAVSLVADATNVTTGDSVVLTATANQDVGATVTRDILIIGPSGPIGTACTSGTVCQKTVSSAAVAANTYHAEIAFSDRSRLQATSNDVTVTWAPHHMVVSPATAIRAPGVVQSYTVEGYDAVDTDLGDVSNYATFSVAGGSCTDNKCSAAAVGDHTVTATIGDTTATANLHVTYSGSTYHEVGPGRVLDSRIPLGATLFHSRVKQTVHVGGLFGIPLDAYAVTGNVTVVNQTEHGYVSVAPTLASGVEAGTSTINFPANDIRANGVTVPLLRPVGTLDFIYWTTNPADTIQIVFDVTGYFARDESGSTYHSVTPGRLVDTRWPGDTALQSRTKRLIHVTGHLGVPIGAVAVTGNVTVTRQSEHGYVSVAPMLTSGEEAATSTINFPVGDNRANGITVPLTAAGTVDVMFWTASASDHVDFIFDITGYFSHDPTGLTYQAVGPGRVLDSRTPLGATVFVARTKQNFTVKGFFGVPAGAEAVTGNLTIVDQTHEGYVSLAPSLTSGVEAGISTLNFPEGDIRANGVIVPLDAGTLDAMFWSGSDGAWRVHVIFDVTGYFGH
jgi:hypothetical protein